MSGLCDLVGGATLFGGTSYTYVADRFNNPNSAIYFNNGYLQVPPGVYFSGDFTVTAWIFLNAHSPVQVIFDFGNGPDSDNNIFLIKDAASSGGLLRSFVNYNSTNYFISTPIVMPNLNQWYHVAFTLSRNIGSIYVNGILILSSPLSLIRSVTRSTNYIGRDSYGDIQINAIYDDLKIYQGALSTAAIQNDYAVSSSGI